MPCPGTVSAVASADPHSLDARLRAYEFPARVMGDRQCLKLTADQAVEVVTNWLSAASRNAMVASTVHPWDDGEGDGWCGLCMHGDGDARCLRCGRSTGGPHVCQCPAGALIGPCAQDPSGPGT